MTTAHPSWNPWTDLHQMLAFHFMVNALLAGTVTAVMAGLIGWYMVLRRQSFAGHTLALVGFPGAAGAILVGVAAPVGYFGVCAAAAVVVAVAGAGRRRGSSQESAAIGTVQAFVLACGLLFVSLYKGFLDSLTGLLFGSFLGVTDDQVLTLAAAAAVAVVVLAAVGRPLLFASVDPDVAAAQGVPVRALGAVFLVLLGTAAAEVSQITGSLLVFALLVMPAAAARQITARPGAGLALSATIAVAVTWLGLGIAYFSAYPVGFYVTTAGFAAYLLAVAARAAAPA